ncbi:tubulin monoglycylase TTLL3-like isoform X2 [Stigmatopora argus]
MYRFTSKSEMAPVEVKALCSLPTTKVEKIRAAKALVEKAVKMQKVFSVQGHYPVIRAGLRARGWVERHLTNAGCRVSSHQSEKDKDDDKTEAVTFSRNKERGDTGEEDSTDQMYNFMSHLVRHEKTYFYWSGRYDYDHCRTLTPNQVTNHYAKTGYFTTKVGLCVNLRNLRWYDTADPDAFFPRCYRLVDQDERHAFIEDFRRTACCSLIKHVVEMSKKTNEHTRDEKKVSSVSAGVINTALQGCQEYLSVLEHSDIDVALETFPIVEEHQWNQFLQMYYMVVHNGASIKSSADFVSRCQAMLVQMKQVCPQMEIDGFNNIWIIKPGAMSRGRGIVCMNRLEQILALVESDTTIVNESKWVVQKYLEQPLLVKGTKFDLRQWFLVTDWNPLTVWFYKECYLRFSTQPYSTTRLDSAIHLCNMAIQKHLQPSRDRHPALPRDNIWSSSDLKAFLHQQGRAAQWESVVVPGMQRALVHVLQTVQDQVEHRKASFELYGADFMLGNDLKPWLLEINANPTMACTSVVTARLCPAVQMDTLKVVLDRRKNPNAFTGGFCLMYKQPRIEPSQFIGVNLMVEGNRILKPNTTKCKPRIVTSKPARSHFSSHGEMTRHSEKMTKHSEKMTKHSEKIPKHSEKVPKHSEKITKHNEKMTKHQAKPQEKVHEHRPSPEKKQETPPPRREEEITVVHNASVMSGEGDVKKNPKPRRRSQRMAGSGESNVAPVTQRKTSFSRTPKSCSVSHVCKSSIKPNQRAHLWRYVVPGTVIPRPLQCLTSMHPYSVPPSCRKRAKETSQQEANYRFYKQRFMQNLVQYIK